MEKENIYQVMVIYMKDILKMEFYQEKGQLLK